MPFSALFAVLRDLRDQPRDDLSLADQASKPHEPRAPLSPTDHAPHLHPRPPSPSGRTGLVRGGRLAAAKLRGVDPPRGRPAGLGARFDVPRLRAPRLLRAALRPALGLPSFGARLWLGTSLGTVVLRPQHLRWRPVWCRRRRVTRADRHQIRGNVAIASRVRRTVAVSRLPAVIHQRHDPRDPRRRAVVVSQLLSENHLRVGRTATDRRRAVRRRGLPGGGDSIYPDPAHPRRRTMIGRYVPCIGGVPPTLGARVLGRQWDGGSEHKDKQQANHRSSSTSGMAAPSEVHARCHWTSRATHP